MGAMGAIKYEWKNKYVHKLWVDLWMKHGWKHIFCLGLPLFF